MDGAGGGLDEGGFEVGEVVDFVYFLSGADRVRVSLSVLQCAGGFEKTYKTLYSANPPGDRLTPIPR